MRRRDPAGYASVPAFGPGRLNLGPFLRDQRRWGDRAAARTGMVKRVLAAVAVLGGVMLLPLLAGPAFAEKRVALVIGNGAYQNVPRLANPIKDAKAIAAMLQKAGFDSVKVRQD